MTKIQKVRKAVIPAAGFGTRFLPQTKAMPKEMLPIVDKPVIQYVVEGLVAAGITDIIIITGYHKRSIEDHFDLPSMELVENLKMGGEKKRHMLDEINEISNLANFIYVRQKGPYGNGTPLINAKEIVGDEPFIYTWSDDMIKATPGEFQQLVDLYEEFKCTILGSVRITEDDDYNKYGFAGGKELRPGIIDIETIVEKPGKENSPSDLGNVSSFLCTSDIFDCIEEAASNLQEGKELYYNDGLNLMLKKGKRILAAEIKGGKYYNAGNQLGYLETVVDFALAHPKIGEDFKKFLKTKV